MKVRHLFLIFLVLGFTVSATAPAFAAQTRDSNTRAAVIDDFNGRVMATQGQNEFPVFKGLALLLGNSLRTGTESWSRLELDEGQFAIIEENTNIQIVTLADNLTRDTRTTRVYMSDGKVWFDISKEPDEGTSFEVKTPTCALSVRGTVFSVTASGENKTTLAVYDGMVVIRAEQEDGTPLLDLNGNEVIMEMVSGSVEFTFDNNKIFSVTQNVLSPRDLAPFIRGRDAGPGGVYRVLYNHMQSNEEFMQKIEVQIEQQTEQRIEQMIQQQIEKPLEQPAEQQFEQQQTEQSVEQPIQPQIEKSAQTVEDMSQAEMKQIVELLTSEPAFPQTILDSRNQNVIIKGDNLRPSLHGVASITGNLRAGAGNEGVYSFEVNLSSGEISSGSMSGQYRGVVAYNLSGGVGSVNGNNFRVSGFHGSVIDSGYTFTNVNRSFLDGTAAYGFNSIGSIGASGIFEIIYGNGGNPFGLGGSIIDGWRVR